MPIDHRLRGTLCGEQDEYIHKKKYKVFSFSCVNAIVVGSDIGSIDLTKTIKIPPQSKIKIRVIVKTLGKYVIKFHDNKLIIYLDEYPFEIYELEIQTPLVEQIVEQKEAWVIEKGIPIEELIDDNKKAYIKYLRKVYPMEKTMQLS